MIVGTLRIASIVATLPFTLIGFVIASFWWDKSVDVVNVKKNKTPILLLHGSNANQHQWLLFRQFLEDDETGHVFSVNLNNLPRKNNTHDDNGDLASMNNYTNRVREKILAMKKLYEDHGLLMDKVTLIGNSMGGLVAGAYCCEEKENGSLGRVEVSALITISTPWKGSWIADHMCSRKIFPDRLFSTESKERSQLVEKVCKLAIPFYTYGSKFDLLVPWDRSSPFDPDSSLSSQDVKREHLIDDKNDHWTTMVDLKLARYIKDNWCKTHTETLQCIQ
jgi:pimeloyl-ACP methyl ester carboxylesterase